MYLKTEKDNQNLFPIISNTSFIVNQDGNVGIGTETVTQKLEVGGNISATNLMLSNHSDVDTTLTNLETDILSNTAKINLNTSSISSNNLSINTLSNDLPILNGNITTNTNDITALQTKTTNISQIGEILNVDTNIKCQKLHLYESTGTEATGTDGTMVLEHGNNGGKSSIVFKSKKNAGSDYGYIQYQDDYENDSTKERSLLTIGTENDTSASNIDNIALMPSGNVGINTKSPSEKLEVNGNIKASGNIESSGHITGQVLMGGIIMFSGTINSNGNPEVNGEVDTNWHLCNGDSGTPDLQDKFVKCGDTSTINTTGGEKQKTLTTSHLPAHTHNIEKSDFSHDHNILNSDLKTAFQHTHNIESTNKEGSTMGTSNLTYLESGTANYNTLTASWQSSADVRTQTVWANDTGDITSLSTGNGSSFEMQPQYYVLAFIMRIA